ncbi:MAG: FliG C-terminal domain-containing protein [Pseudomonadota bacterium]
MINSAPSPRPEPEASPTGLSKAAALMQALGEQASPVWAALTPEEAHLIAGEMQHLPPQNPGSAERTLAALLDPPLTGHASPLAARAANQAASPALDPVWGEIDRVSPRKLAAFLAQESAQVSAIILSRISPAQAGATVRALPEDHALAILHRMVALKPPTETVLNAVTHGLQSFLRTATSPIAGPQKVAQVLEAMGEDDAPALLAALTASGAPGAEDVARLVKPFETIADLGPAGLQTLIAHANHDTLALALKGAPETVLDAIAANMTQRAAAILSEDMEALGPVPKRDVDAARAQIVGLVRDLVQRGDIRADGDREDEDLIE